MEFQPGFQFEIFWDHAETSQQDDWFRKKLVASYASVNGHLELPLLKDPRSFEAVSTSNLEVYKFRDWWILTHLIFGHSESSLNNIQSMVNLERTCVLLFYYFLCLKVNLDLEKANQLGESSPNFIFVVVNLDPISFEKGWIDGEFWPYDFVEKVNRGEYLRWVGSRCPLTRALIDEISLKENLIQWKPRQIDQAEGFWICRSDIQNCKYYTSFHGLGIASTGSNPSAIF